MAWNADAIMGWNLPFCLEMFEEKGAELIETDKIINQQLEKATISRVVAFGKQATEGLCDYEKRACGVIMLNDETDIPKLIGVEPEDMGKDHETALSDGRTAWDHYLAELADFVASEIAVWGGDIESPGSKERSVGNSL